MYYVCVLIQLKYTVLSMGNAWRNGKEILLASQSVAEIKLSIVDAVVKKCVNSLIYAVRGRQ